MSHLESVLSNRELTPEPQPSTATFSITSGSTISPSATSISPRAIVSMHLDEFFGNIVSVLDVFAHVVNLVYMNSPFSEREVYFDARFSIIDEMENRYPNEEMTRCLSSIREKQWYVDMKPYRHLETHNRTIPFWPKLKSESTSRISLSEATTILIPDDPFADPPVYNQNREMRIFGVNVFTNTLSEIDNMYATMEARVRTANNIPV